MLSPKPELDMETSDDDLPLYSLLIPLFHEDHMVEALVQACSQFNYPTEKLDIFFICEAEDHKTIKEVESYAHPPFNLVVVPKGVPQTKPRALNYALKRAKGDFVTIYDAEDKPHPDQLKAAISAFRKKPEWTSLQAPLDYYNAKDSWLTRQFTLEYAALFHVWLPFLSRLGIPFPLGGTSNHMRREALELCEGWDAHNVTEDADLSFRLAAMGHKIGYITPPTGEEAVSGLRAWHKQRSRWMKGYIQTWLVHMHKPLKPLSFYGILRFLSLQITLGYTLLSALIFTPAVFCGLLYLIGHYSWGWVLPFSSIYFTALIFSLCIGILIAMVGVWRAGKSWLIPWAIFMPFYWMLLFVPTVMAIVEMRTRPFYWHKTEHGVSSQSETQDALHNDRSNPKTSLNQTLRS